MKWIVFVCIAVLAAFAVDPAHAQFVSERAIDSTNTAEIEEQKMVLRVLDSSSRREVRADVVVKGLNPRKPVVFRDIEDTTIVFKNYRLYTVSVVKKGYMYYARKFWPDESIQHIENIELKPLRVGLKTNVEDITFLGDQTDVALLVHHRQIRLAISVDIRHQHITRIRAAGTLSTVRK